VLVHKKRSAVEAATADPYIKKKMSLVVSSACSI